MSTKTNSPEFLNSIIENVPYGFVSTDTNGKVTLVNQQTLDHLNLKGKPSDFLGIDFLDFLPSSSRRIRRTFQKYIYKNPVSFNIEDLDFSGKLLNIRGRNFPEGMIMSIFDVTEALQTRNQDTLNLLQGEELNRRKLYKELHDGIGSLISTISLKLDVVKTELDDVQQKTITKINSVRELMQTATNDLRSISQTLIPSSLIDFGLVTALEDLCKTTSSLEPIHAHFYQSGVEKRLDINLELGIFRIVQEVLSNTLNHGNAENVFIQLVKHDDYISLIVEDDGVGVDKSKMKEILQNGVGLRNIKTRTKSFNGSFHIDSSLGKGVTVSIEFPTDNK